MLESPSPSPALSLTLDYIKPAALAGSISLQSESYYKFYISDSEIGLESRLLPRYRILSTPLPLWDVVGVTIAARVSLPLSSPFTQSFLRFVNLILCLSISICDHFLEIVFHCYSLGEL